MKSYHYDGITQGKLNNPEAFREKLQRYEAKRITITISDEKKRSTDQNRYWWGVVIRKITEWLQGNGNDVTDNDVHEFIKMKYLGEKEVKIDGKIYKRYRGTSELNTQEFADLVEKIQRDFAQRGLIIPDPNQEEFL